MSKHKLMWVYPWDIVAEGIEECLYGCREMGLDAVSVAGLYHSGKFLLPRNPRNRVYFPEPGVCYFRPDEELYQNSKIQPMVSLLVEEGGDPYREIREWCRRIGLEFEAWVLGFHNTGIGSRHPDACIENAYGDRYPFALCPANPDARGFVQAVVRDVVANVQPDSLFLETHNYLNYLHGFHHEYVPVPHGDLERFLLSLCFCRHCAQLGQGSGINAGSLRKRVQELLDDRFQRYQTPDVWMLENFDELLELLQGDDELKQYTDMRSQVVTGWTAEFADICHQDGVGFSIVASLFARPSTRAWMEGTDISAQSELVDTMGILSYFPEVEAVAEDVDHAMSVISDPTKLRLALNVALPDTPSLEVLETKIQAGLDRGVEKFGFYNYGFMNTPRIEWLTESIERSLAG